MFGPGLFLFLNRKKIKRKLDNVLREKACVRRETFAARRRPFTCSTDNALTIGNASEHGALQTHTR